MPTTIDIAVEVLEESVARAGDGPQQTAGVRLALRVLLSHAPKQWLVDYWEACGSDDADNRQRHLRRCLDNLKLRLKR